MIDIDKFITSILSNPKSIIDTSTQFCINKALLEQGLEFRDGSIKDILEDAVVDSNEDGLIADTIKQGEQKLYGLREECKDCQFNYAGECKGSCAMKRGEQKPANKVEPKFKVKYAGSEYNVLEVKDIAGVTYYGIEDEPNHIDYVQAENCERVGGYSIKENGSPYPTKPAVFSEQKPANKVKPKFREGEWIYHEISGNAFHINRIENCTYISDEGAIISFGRQNHWRLWTIQDAKDGDVLAYVTDEEDLWIMIYWSLYEPYEGHVHYHALLVNDNFSNKGTCCISINNLKPATKEQRDKLEKAMADAGYTFDFEKKELKKIEQKSSWSEEDEKRLTKVLVTLNDAYASKELFNWLISLKDRYTWKPSENQLECLEYAIDKAEKDWSPLTNNRIYLTLKALKEELKKL